MASKGRLLLSFRLVASIWPNIGSFAGQSAATTVWSRFVTRGVQGGAVRHATVVIVMAGFVTAAGVSPNIQAHAAAPSSNAVHEETAQPQSLDSSLSKAQKAGKSVEVDGSLTETSSVVANPNGTFTMRSHVKPVRVKKNGVWRDIDTRLSAQPDGALVPLASPLDLVFSGGGGAPLVTLADGARAVSLSWPAELPKPVVNGSSATYPDVLPGVDLQVTADVTGFSEVLIVRDAVAARNPALTNIKFTATATGLNLEAANDGTFSVRDSSGRTVFTSSTPMMWDSSHTDGAAPTAIDPGDGRLAAMKIDSRKTVVGKTTSVSTMDIRLTPDLGRLSGPDVRYPLYLDPQMSRTSEAWAEVTSNGWHYFNAGIDAQVGNCDWDRCDGPAWVARSFFQIPTPDLMSRNGVKARIYEASFFALQTHGTSCVAEATDLYLTGPISADTRWGGPGGSFVSQKASSAGDQCGGAGWVQFDAFSAAQYAVDHNSANLTFGLRAPDENNKYQWKKFANNPHLDVVFNFPPNHATGLRVSNAVTCNNKIITPDAFPTFHATATDNNTSPLNLNLRFEVRKLAPPDIGLKAKSPPIQIASGGDGSWQSPVNLVDALHQLGVLVENVFPGDASRNFAAEGGTQQVFFFVSRSAPITQVPSITSTDYPVDYWGQPQSLPGKFTFNANGAANIAGFTYTFTGSGTEAIPSTTDCDYNKVFDVNGGWVASSNGNATVTVPRGLSPGRHTLHVRSFDDAHKLSSESQAYTFYVAPTLTPVAPTVKLEAESLSYTADPGVAVSVIDSGVPGISGGKYLQASSLADNASLFVNFTVPAEGDYDIAAAMAGGPSDYADVAFFLGSTWVGEEYFFSGSSPETPAFRPMNFRLTGVHLTAGTQRLRLWGWKGSSAQETWLSGLDYLQLTPTVKLDLEAMPEVRSDSRTDLTPCCTEQGLNNGSFAKFLARAVNQSVSVRLTVPVEADYTIRADIMKSDSYGQYVIDIDGKPLARTDVTPIDGYSATPARGSLSLGGIHLTAGPHTLTIKVVGKNPSSSNHFVGIDYFVALPINNVTAASFTDAMNNKGISVDNGATASMDFEGSSVSKQTLAAAGLQPGSTVTVSGARFTMPAPHTATGNDNVIATGQTIPFAASEQVKANAVGMLVMSTCGAAPSITGTITYTDGTTSNPLFPAIADWAVGPTDSATVVLPYRNTPTGPQPQYGPRIYAIFPPANPTKTLRSITLPNYGTSFISGCLYNATHVLALAPRSVAVGWIGAWTAPPESIVPVTGFSNATVRSVVRPSAIGSSVQVRLSNTDGLPVTIGSASIAAHAGSGAATVGTPAALTFGGAASVIIPAGGEVFSDPVPAPVGGDGKLVVSAHLPNQVTKAPLHASATTPSYLAPGNATGDKTGTPYTATLTGTYYITGINASTSEATKGTVVGLGDRSTSAGASDGARSTWIDELPGKISGTPTPVPGGLVNGSLADLTVTGAPGLLQRTTASAPNLRTVLVSLGANDILAGRSATGIQQDFRALLMADSANGLKRLSRTDGSPVRSVLTTVPPLGLDANDQREKERQILNTYIRTNSINLGADHMVDFDQAVRDTNALNKIAAGYLTSGAPNTAYHDKLAETLANAITRFPPEAQL